MNNIEKAVRICFEEGPIELVERSVIFYYRKTLTDFKYRNSNSSDKIYVRPRDIDYYLIEGSHPATSHRQIKECANRHKLEKAVFNPEIFKGKVIPGDWDKHKEDYQYDRVYQGIKSIYIENEDWENTHLGHRSLLKEKIQGIDHSNYVKEVDYLFQSMDKNGYSESKSDSPLRINIGRDGELIFNNSNGHKRIAISKLVNIDQIPVEVIVRHKKWEELRNTISEGGVPEGHEELNSHPDLQDILN